MCAITLRRMPGGPYSMSMRRAPPALWIPVVLLAVAIQGGCDLFSEPGLADVDLEYTGQTSLSCGDTVPVEVRAEVGGVVLGNPRLAVTSSAPGKVEVLAGGEAIHALDTGGSPQLVIQLLTSWATDSVPTIRQGIQVTGPCPL